MKKWTLTCVQRTKNHSNHKHPTSHFRPVRHKGHSVGVVEAVAVACPDGKWLKGTERQCIP